MAKRRGARSPLRVLVLMHEDLVPPEDAGKRPAAERATAPWKAEHDVLTALARLGHEPRALGVRSDLGVIKAAIEEQRPHIAFNLLEEFHGLGIYDQHVVSYLELLRRPYTGCNPRGLTLARDKALTKKILAYHRIRVPAFQVFPRGRRITRPGRLAFPLLVKSLVEEASMGISQASIVHNDEKLAERVAFVHRKLGSDAIAEQYVEGRELYVAVLGNDRLRTFPIWELSFKNLPEAAEAIATEKVKFDPRYQKKVGVKVGAAENIPEPLAQRIHVLCRRIYRLLGLTGYGRIDLRLTEAGEIFVLEANPNPNLEDGEDFAASAKVAGLKYRAVIQRILNLGLARAAEWEGEEPEPQKPEPGPGADTGNGHGPGRGGERGGERASERSGERSTERSTDRASERPTERASV